MSRMTIRLAHSVVALAAAVALAGCPTAAVPELAISQVAFAFGNDVPEDAFTITNTGQAALEWFITADDVPPWLGLSSLAGTVDANSSGAGDDVDVVTMSVIEAEAALLAPGLYPEQFTVFSNGSNQVISASLRVTTAGDLIIDPLAIDFGATISQASFTVRNGGTEALNWEIASIAPVDQWLSILAGSPREGTITSETQTVNVAVDRGTLLPGIYTGSISITSDGGNATIAITMTVAELAGLLSVAPDTLGFTTDAQDTAIVAVRNTGTGTINWTITDDLPAWLTFDATAGEVSAVEVDRLTLTIDASAQVPGTLSHTVRFTAVEPDNDPAGVETLLVTLVVPAPIPELSVAPQEIFIEGQQTEDFFRIENTGTGTLTWTVTPNEPWIVISNPEDLTGTSTIDSDIIDFTVDRATLAPGTQIGTVTVTSNDVTGGTVNVTISVEVFPPTLAVVPQVLDFDTNVVSRRILIFNSGVGTVNWEVDTSALPSWLQDTGGNPLLTAVSGTVSGSETDSIEISVNRSGLDPGDYAWPCTSVEDCVAPGDFPTLLPELVVTSDAGAVALRLFMSVSENPVFAVNTAGQVDLNGISFVDVGLESTGQFTVSNEGTGSLTWSIDDSGFPTWLEVSPLGPSPLDAEDGEVPITITIDRTGLSFGSNTHTLLIQTGDPDNPTVPVRIEMVVPKRIVIGTNVATIDFGLDGITANLFVANFGDPGTELEFRIASDKEWLFAFPAGGRSIGVDDIAFPDFQQINVSIDRTGLSERGSGTATLLITAVRFEENNEGIIVEVPDPNVAPLEILISAEAAELSIEAAPARLRVPSQIRHVMTLRNLRYGPVIIPDDILSSFEGGFFLFEDNLPVEASETSFFLTSATNARTDLAILLDYSGSALQSAAIASANHLDVLAQLRADALANGTGRVFEDFAGFETAADPLQFLYNETIGKLISELPAHYRIAIREFHDRDQEGTTVIGFTPNDATGRASLIAALESINVTDHGATELIPAIIDGATSIFAEDIPIPSSGPVVPVISFNDADVRGILLVSDGRMTTGPEKITDAADVLASFRTRLISVAWGEETNAGPMATLGASSGGHLYVTRLLPNGNTLDEDTERVPAIDTLYDWCSTDLADDPCDLSIAEDAKAQVVLSYVTLSAEDKIAGRVSATFDDPSDGNSVDACALPDQRNISGEFEQDLEPASVAGALTSNAFGGGISNIAQVGMQTAGNTGGTAVVEIFSDYMPRDIRTMQFVFAAESAGVAQASFSIDDIGLDLQRALVSLGGIASQGWTLTQTGTGIDPATALNTITFVLSTGEGPADTTGDAVEYGAFGVLLRANVLVPGNTPYDFRLLSVTGQTGNGEIPGFAHPDGIPVASEIDGTPIPEFAPSLPAPRLSNTILDFGAAAVSTTFTISNVGGSFDGGDVALYWDIVGEDRPTAGVTVGPFRGILSSTTDEFEVTVSIDRSAFSPGALQNVGFTMNIATGIGGVVGAIPFVIDAAIQPPVLAVVSGSFSPPGTQTLNFGSAAADSGVQGLTFDVINSEVLGGQSVLDFFRTDDQPVWLTALTEGEGITVDTPFPILVTVDRSLLPVSSPFNSPQTFTHAIEITGTSNVGAIVGETTVLVVVTVVPQAPIIQSIANDIVAEGDTYTGPTPVLAQGGGVPVVWTLLDGPAGMSIDADTGVVFYSSASVNGSPHFITIQVENAENAALFDIITWQLTVTPTPVLPIINAIADDTVVDGTAYTGTTPSLSQGSTPVTFSLVQGAPGMIINLTTGVMTWPAADISVSPVTVGIRAVNAAGSDIEFFTLTVTP